MTHAQTQPPHSPLNQNELEQHIFNIYHPDTIHPDVLAASRRTLDNMHSNVHVSWEFCANVLNNTSQPQVHRFCLSHFKAALSKHIYESLPSSKKQIFKSSIKTWFERVCKNSNFTARHAVAELGSVYALLFRREFPTEMPTFFDDLLAQTSNGPSGIFPVLEILRIVNEDVIIDEPKSGPIKSAAHNSSPGIIHFFFRLMTHFEKSRPDIVREAISTLEIFVAWVEISLFINPQFKDVFQKLLANSEYSVSILSLYSKIAKRGMYPVHRMESFLLMDFFNQSANLIETLQSPETLVLLSGFINTLAEYLIDFLEITDYNEYGPPIKLFSSPSNFQSCCRSNLKILLPLVVKLFSSNSHDISLPVVPALTRWINYLENTPSPPPPIRNMISSVLRILPSKFQLAPNFTLDAMTDVQDQRLTSRSHYSRVFYAIFRYNPAITLEFIEVGMNQLFSSQTIPFYLQEAILTLFWRVGEYYNSIKSSSSRSKHHSSHGNASDSSEASGFSSNSSASLDAKNPSVQALLNTPVEETVLFRMFSKMIQNDIHNLIKRPIVLEAVLKNIVRYLKTFGDALPKQCWESCLRFFLGPSAIYNESSPAIRSRSYYHLYLLVSAAPSIILNFQSQIVTAITPLLSISSSSIGDGLENLGITTPPVSPSLSPRSNLKGSSLSSVSNTSKVSFDTQLYLYRIISILACEQTKTNNNAGIEMMRHFLSPVMLHLNSLKSTSQHWNNPNDPKSFVRVLLLRRDIDAVVALSKEVHSKSSLAPLFHSTVSDIGQSVFLLPQYEELRETIIIYLHAIIPLLNQTNIQLVLDVIKKISSLADVAQMRKVVQLLCQIIARIGGNSVPFIQNILLPLTTALHECVKRSGNGDAIHSDLAKETNDIWIEYYKFLNYIFVHKAGPVFWSPEIFPSLPKLVEQVAMDSLHPSIRRASRCLVFLHHLIQKWPNSNLDLLSRFVQFEVLPLCFASILRGTLATEKMSTAINQNQNQKWVAISPMTVLQNARTLSSIRPTSSDAGDMTAAVALILHATMGRLGDSLTMQTISKLLTPLGVPLTPLQTLSTDISARRISKVKDFLKTLMSKFQ